jgi:hypothetical protein
MRAQVTDQGILIPKHWLEGIREVEIRKELHRIVIIPVRTTDPIFALGSDPVPIPLADASTDHDRYLAEE